MGMLYTTHAMLSTGKMEDGSGTFMNITSTATLEVLLFRGKAIYHTTEAAQEAFTTSPCTEM